MASPTEPAPFPVGDPQFWIVTLIALAAAAWLVWKLLPKRVFGRHRRAGQKHATLTVSGQPISGRRGSDCH